MMDVAAELGSDDMSCGCRQGAGRPPRTIPRVARDGSWSCESLAFFLLKPILGSVQRDPLGVQRGPACMIVSQIVSQGEHAPPACQLGARSRR